jgi:hypothetical protein
VISQFNQVGDKFFDPVLQKQFGYDHEAKVRAHFLPINPGP